jgi:membrane protease YdiL (CAAX protease family)
MSGPLGAEILIAAAVLVLGLGVSAWVFLPALQGPEAARRYLGSHRLAFGSLVVVVLVNLVLTVPIAPFIRASGGLTTGTFLIAALSTQIPMLLVIYLRLIAPGALAWRELGLRPLALDRIVRLGLTGGLIGIVLSAIVTALLSQIGLRPNQLDQFQFMRTETPIIFGLILVTAAISAPFAEELFFRGFLFGLYQRTQPLWVAYLVPGVIFAALHLEPGRMNLTQMAGLGIGIFLLGMLLTWLYQRSGSLYPGMLAHAVNNATGLILFYATGLT